MAKSPTFTRATCNAMNAGKREPGMVYYFERGDVVYQARAPHGGFGWEVVSIATSKGGGRAWRWAKNLTKGVVADVLAQAQALHGRPADDVEPRRWCVQVEMGTLRYGTLYVSARTARHAMLVAQAQAGHSETVSRLAVEACLAPVETTAPANDTPAPAPAPAPTVINVQLQVSDQFLRDVLCTAAEGGSNYWANFRAIKNHQGEHGAEWETVRITDHGEGEGTQERKVIGLPELREGVRVMLERGKCADRYKSALLECIVADDAGNCDAELADLVLQSTFFNGDVVYG